MYDLSIVIPVRDTPLHLLDRCLHSIKCNINDGISIQKIVIDDCSNSLNYNEYHRLIKSRYPDFLIKRMPSWSGIGGARNRGAKISKSEYIMFVDSDDVLREKSIKKLMNYATNSRIVFSNHIKQDLKNNISSIYNKSIWMEILKKYPSGLNCPFLYSNFIGVPSVIPLNAFNKVGGYPELIYSGEHISLWGKLYFNLNLELLHIDEILYEYYPRLNGNCYSNIPKHVAGKCEQFKNIAKLVGLYFDNYVWVAKGQDGFSCLYAPHVGNNINLPLWSSIKNSPRKWFFAGQDDITSKNQNNIQPTHIVGSQSIY